MVFCCGSHSKLIQRSFTLCSVFIYVTSVSTARVPVHYLCNLKIRIKMFSDCASLSCLIPNCAFSVYVFLPLMKLASGLSISLCEVVFFHNESALQFINSTFVLFSDSLISACLYSVLLSLDLFCCSFYIFLG